MKEKNRSNFVTNSKTGSQNKRIDYSEYFLNVIKTVQEPKEYPSLFS